MKVASGDLVGRGWNWNRPDVCARFYTHVCVLVCVYERVGSRRLGPIGIISIAFSFRNQTIRGFCAITWRNWFKIGCPRRGSRKRGVGIALQFRWNVAKREREKETGTGEYNYPTIQPPSSTTLVAASSVLANALPGRDNKFVDGAWLPVDSSFLR